MLMVRKWLAGLLALALCLAGNVVSAPEHTVPNAPFSAPSMRVSLTPSVLDIVADVASETHADRLERIIDERFPKHATTVSWRTDLAADADWQLLTLASIDVLAETSVVKLHLEPSGLELAGLRPEDGLFEVRLARLAAIGGDAFETDVAVSETGVLEQHASIQDACPTMFSTLSGEPIRFFFGTADLRPSSLPLLDRYAEFAADCPESRLAIAGHTDASGDEGFNLYLSEQRARAVAKYLVRAGIEHDRLRAEGKGSAEPVADNSSAWSRSQNRRIEVMLEP